MVNSLIDNDSPALSIFQQPWAKRSYAVQPQNQGFIDTYAPYAEKWSKKTGIPAEVYLAIGASETNWGKAGSVFGIKGPSPSGTSTTYKTWEMVNGQRVDIEDQFATYSDPDEAFQHFNDLISKGRYQGSYDYLKKSGDVSGWLQRVNQAGYATDPNWSNSIMSIASGLTGGQMPSGPNPPSTIAPPGIDPAVHAPGARPVTYGNEAVDAMLKPWHLPELEDVTGDAMLGSRMSQPDYGPATAQMQATSDAWGQLRKQGFDGSDMFSRAKDAADAQVKRFAEPATAILGQAIDSGAVPSAPLFNAGRDLLGLGDKVPSAGAISAPFIVPQDSTDAVLTVGPGNILKGVKGVKGVLKGAGKAGGVLSIISDADRAKNARKMYDAAIKAGMTDKDIAAAFGQSALDLAKGGAASARGVTAGTKLETQAQSQAARNVYERVLEATGDPGAATEAARKAAGAEAGATKRVRATATELSERMGSGAVEPKKTGWTITNKAGESRRVETELPHGYADAADPMKRFEQNVADQDALNRSIKADKGVQRAKNAREGIEAIKRGANGFVDNAPPPGAILDANGNVDIAATLADEADRIAREGVTPRTADTLAGLASAAKRLGDPASEIRRQIQQGDEPDAGNAATRRGDEFKDAAAAERQAARDERAAARAAKDAERTAAQEAKFAERDAWIEKNRAAVAAGRAGLDADLPKVAGDAITAEKASQRLKAAREAAQTDKPGGAGGLISGALGAPRALALSMDMGTLRDLTILGSSRKGLPAAVTGANQGRKAYFSAEAAEEAQAAVKASPWYDFVTSGQNFKRPAHFYQYGDGVSPDLRVPEMSSLGNNPVSQIVGKLPHVRMSDRALAVQRNVAGMHLLEARADELALKYGDTTEEFYREMQSTIDHVNHIRGFSGGGVAKGLSAINALISPQQMISRLQILGDPINFALRGDWQSAKFAGETLLGFASSQTALMLMLRLSGEQTGRWSVNANPLDGDFGQVQIGNSRVDTLAGLGPIIKTGARIAAITSDKTFDTDFAKNHSNVKDLVEQWITNKQNPVAHLFYDMAKKMELPDTKTLAGLVAPSIAMGIMESIKENRGANKLLAIPNAAANFVGLGSNTYKNAFDEANEISTDTYDGRKFDDLNDLERLPVIAKLPEDNKRAVVTQERQRYEAQLEKAGVVTKAPERETDTEATKRAKRNAEIIASNPDLDVQQWFWEGKDATEFKKGKGTVDSLEAAEKAAGLGIPNRPVKLSGADRDLAASDDDRKALKEKGKLVDQYLHPSQDLVDQFVQAPKYKGMKPDEARKAAETDVKAAIRAIPSVDAALAFFGVGGDDKEYKLHSTAAFAELDKLWKAYPGAAQMAKPGMSVGFVKGAK